MNKDKRTVLTLKKYAAFYCKNKKNILTQSHQTEFDRFFNLFQLYAFDVCYKAFSDYDDLERFAMSVASTGDDIAMKAIESKSKDVYLWYQTKYLTSKMSSYVHWYNKEVLPYKKVCENV